MRRIKPRPLGPRKLRLFSQWSFTACQKSLVILSAGVVPIPARLYLNIEIATTACLSPCKQLHLCHKVSRPSLTSSPYLSMSTASCATVRRSVPVHSINTINHYAATLCSSSRSGKAWTVRRPCTSTRWASPTFGRRTGDNDQALRRHWASVR